MEHTCEKRGREVVLWGGRVEAGEGEGDDGGVRKKIRAAEAELLEEGAERESVDGAALEWVMDYLESDLQAELEEEGEGEGEEFGADFEELELQTIGWGEGELLLDDSESDVPEEGEGEADGEGEGEAEGVEEGEGAAEGEGVEEGDGEAEGERVGTAGEEEGDECCSHGCGARLCAGEEVERGSEREGECGRKGLVKPSEIYFGYLLEASDDQLGIPPSPSGLSDTSSLLQTHREGGRDMAVSSLSPPSPSPVSAPIQSVLWDEQEGSTVSEGVYEVEEEESCGGRHLQEAFMERCRASGRWESCAEGESGEDLGFVLDAASCMDVDLLELNFGSVLDSEAEGALRPLVTHAA